MKKSLEQYSKEDHGIKKKDVDLNVVKINDGTAIAIPDPDNQQGPNDYRHWIWTEDTLQFSWDTNGHLLMEIV